MILSGTTPIKKQQYHEGVSKRTIKGGEPLKKKIITR